MYLLFLPSFTHLGIHTFLHTVHVEQHDSHAQIDFWVQTLLRYLVCRCCLYSQWFGMLALGVYHLALSRDDNHLGALRLDSIHYNGEGKPAFCESAQVLGKAEAYATALYSSSILYSCIVLHQLVQVQGSHSR